MDLAKAMCVSAFPVDIWDVFPLFAKLCDHNYLLVQRSTFHQSNKEERVEYKYEYPILPAKYSGFEYIYLAVNNKTNFSLKYNTKKKITGRFLSLYVVVLFKIS